MFIVFKFHGHVQSFERPLNKKRKEKLEYIKCIRSTQGPHRRDPCRSLRLLRSDVRLPSEKASEYTEKQRWVPR